MSAKSGSLTCMATCWAIAALVGGLAAVLLWMLAGYSFMQGAFMGALAFVVVGVLLTVLMCRPLPPPAGASVSGKVADAATASPRPAAMPAAAPVAEAAPAPAPEPVAAAPEPQPAPAPEAAEAEAGTKPELLAAPRGGRGDDLKKIKGIGPGLEKSLNEQGVWHYAQIASWTEAELVWADQNLIKFKGRITRDDWVGQAKILAADDKTEFSKRSG
jgi:predicted flap endonuclease-1-like 5' DNA nuclease